MNEEQGSAEVDDRAAGERYRAVLAEEPEQLEAWLGTAALLARQGNLAAAAERLSALTATNEGSVPLFSLLGDIRYELGEYPAALECYQSVLDVQPDHPGARVGLAQCLWQQPALVLALHSRETFAATLSSQDVDPDVLCPAAAVLLRTSDDLLSESLLVPLLRHVLVTDPEVELTLTRVRRELCLAPTPRAPELALALAEQCRRNEFAWTVSEDEWERLPTAPGWVRAMYGPEEVDPVLLARARRIPRLTTVSAGNSSAVRDMYEANPYPRWLRLSSMVPTDLDQLLRRLMDDRWEPPGFLRRPRVLVAGCGTGRDLLSAAQRWRPAAITGFDLSRTSLAYTGKMAERLGIDVELYQADLLLTGDWEREFDAIVCTGVLHHLADPMQGWRQLVRLLRPGGVMLVGLYSESARRRVVAAQSEARDLGVPPTPSGIRAVRAHLLALPPEHPARGCMVLRDFYYLTGCRDMLLHVREHRFTVQRIAAALEELGLRFLDFDTAGPVRRRYRTLFGPGASLRCWEKFEDMYPEVFIGMYQFWCQRPEVGAQPAS